MKKLRCQKGEVPFFSHLICKWSVGWLGLWRHHTVLLWACQLLNPPEMTHPQNSPFLLLYISSVIHCFSYPCFTTGSLVGFLQFPLVEWLTLLQILMSVLWVDTLAMPVRIVTIPLDPITVWSAVELAFEEPVMGWVVKVYKWRPLLIFIVLQMKTPACWIT